MTFPLRNIVNIAKDLADILYLKCFMMQFFCILRSLSMRLVIDFYNEAVHCNYYVCELQHEVEFLYTKQIRVL